MLPELSIMEVSGIGAPPLHVDPSLVSWEDLRASSGHDITDYKVYRSDYDPAGTFDCAFTGPGTDWPGGDPDTPLLDEAFYYLVTAVNAAGVESAPGTGTGSRPRMVDTASACP